MALVDTKLLEGQLTLVYDLYRTARLNRKYYGDRLAAYQKWNTFVELIVALGTSTAIGGLVFLQIGLGKTVLASIGVLAVVIGVVKTSLQLSQKIERYSRLYTSHSVFYSELDSLVSEISAHQGITAERMKSFSDIQQKINLLAPEDDPHPSGKLRLKYFQEVNEEIPPERLWMPKELNTEGSHAASS
jgi:hypothetical protein